MLELWAASDAPWALRAERGGEGRGRTSNESVARREEIRLIDMRVGVGQAQLLLSPLPSLSLFPSLRLHHLTLPSSPYPFLSSSPSSSSSSSSSSFPVTCTTNNNFNYNSNFNHGDHHDHGTGGNNNNNNNGGWWPWNWEEGGSSDDNNNKTNHFLLLCLLFLLPCGGLALALANAESIILWEVSRGTRRKVLIGDDGCFVSPTRGSGGDDDKYKQGGMPSYWWQQCRDIVVGLMLPHGYPHSVSADYMEYSLWRGVQGIASQVSGVLSTQVPTFLPSFLPYSVTSVLSKTSVN